MTQILEKAYNKLTQAPENEQERIAALILAELEKPAPEAPPKTKGLLAQLREIKIDAPADFAENFDLYASGEKPMSKVDKPDGKPQKKGFIERLMEIQIDGPEDLSENFEQYANGEKRFDKVR